MNKIKNNLNINKIKENLKWSVRDIATGAIIVAMAVALFWVRIPLPFMNNRLDYFFYILIGFLFHWSKGVILGTIADTLILTFRGFIGSWFWSYGIIPLMIVTIICILKNLTKIKDKMHLKILITVFNTIFAIAVTLLLLINFFKNGEGKVGIVVLSIILAIYLLFTLFIIGFVWITKNEKWFNFIVVYIIVFSTLVLMLWVWGPTSFIIWMQHMGSTKYNFHDKYLYLLIPRVIKSIVESVLFSPIIFIVCTQLDFLKQRSANKKI